MSDKNHKILRIMIKKLFYIFVGFCAFILIASEGFIQYALKPKLKDIPTAGWVDSVLSCGALRDTFLISNDSGDSIHAWYMRADSASNKVAVLVHGYTDNAFMMAPYAEIYDRQLHYNIILPDLHYHGQSGGEYVQMGWRDRLDVMQWCAMADSLFADSTGTTKQVLHGVSMGAATVMCVSGEELPSYIKCFVEDCGYTSVWDEFTNELDNQFSMPPFPFLYTTSWLNKLQNGWSFKEASALDQVARCTMPMLFIHGSDDDFVKTEMIYRLYDAKSQPKQLRAFEGSKHAMSYHDNKVEYTRLVTDFVAKHNR